MGSADPKSGPYDCVASNLLTRPSPFSHDIPLNVVRVDLRLENPRIIDGESTKWKDKRPQRDSDLRGGMRDRTK